MVDEFKELVGKQFEAALSTLNMCVEQCPEEVWKGPVANMTFCQVAFHTLFYADCYLGKDTEALKVQAFHRDNPDFFRDYEEMEDREQKQMYDKASIDKYMAFCRQKAIDVIGVETAETLAAECGFYWLGIPRAELYLYNIRHVQHHAAQLIMRLRLDTDVEVGWVKSGWRE